MGGTEIWVYLTVLDKEISVFAQAMRLVHINSPPPRNSPFPLSVRGVEVGRSRISGCPAHTRSYL